ncbi:MAG: hypothetical protein IKI57_03895 [Clostridia bacterium]|nr:hypothetical protein [Clostridia bacterium]
MSKKAIFLMSILFVATFLTACNFKKEDEINTNKDETTFEIVANKNADEYSLGSWDGDTYVNSFLKVKLKLPSNWRRMSNEEISLSRSEGINYEQLGLNKDLLKQIIENDVVTYVNAQDLDTNSIIEIQTQRVSDSLTVEKNLEDIKKAMENQKGIYYHDFQITKENLMGREFLMLSFKADVPGKSVYQALYVERHSNLMMQIFITGNVDVDSIFLKY